MRENKDFPLREWKQECHPIDQYTELCGSIEEMCRMLRSKAKGLKGAYFDMDQNYDEIEFFVRGWVRKSPEEIAEFDCRSALKKKRSKKAAKTREDKDRERAIKEIQRLKERYPDLMDKV